MLPGILSAVPKPLKIVLVVLLHGAGYAAVAAAVLLDPTGALAYPVAVLAGVLLVGPGLFSLLWWLTGGRQALAIDGWGRTAAHHVTAAGTTVQLRLLPGLLRTGTVYSPRPRISAVVVAAVGLLLYLLGWYLDGPALDLPVALLVQSTGAMLLALALGRPELYPQWRAAPGQSASVDARIRALAREDLTTFTELVADARTRWPDDPATTAHVVGADLLAGRFGRAAEYGVARTTTTGPGAWRAMADTATAEAVYWAVLAGDPLPPGAVAGAEEALRRATRRRALRPYLGAALAARAAGRLEYAAALDAARGARTARHFPGARAEPDALEAIAYAGLGDHTAAAAALARARRWPLYRAYADVAERLLRETVAPRH
jgi:hypothetical protein